MAPHSLQVPQEGFAVLSTIADQQRMYGYMSGIDLQLTLTVISTGQLKGGSPSLLAALGCAPCSSTT